MPVKSVGESPCTTGSTVSVRVVAARAGALASAKVAAAAKRIERMPFDTPMENLRQNEEMRRIISVRLKNQSSPSTRPVWNPGRGETPAATRRSGAGEGADLPARRVAQRVLLVRLLPREGLLRASEVPVRRGLLVDGAEQVEALDDLARLEAEH